MGQVWEGTGFRGFGAGLGKVEKQAGESRMGCAAPILRFTAPGNAVRSGVSGPSTVQFLGWVADKVVSKMGGL